jgi:hypothetical protein
MPYKSEAQRRYFNANRKKLESDGVDVDHWNKESKGKKVPEKKAFDLAKKAAYSALLKMSADDDEPYGELETARRNLAGALVSVLPAIGNIGYQKAFLKGDPATLARSRGNALLGSWFKSETARGARNGISPTNMGIDTQKGVPRYSTKPPIRGQGPHYNFNTRQVYVPGGFGRSEDARLGLLAHELGHAEQFRKSNPTNSNFRSLFGGSNRARSIKGSAILGQLGGTLGPTFTNDSDSAGIQALVGSAMSAPQLANEAGASARGSRTLINYAKENGLWKNKNALQKLKFAGRSWIGMPTYLLAAAAPIVTYLGFSLAGTYDKKPAQSISEEISRSLAGKKN